MPELPEVAVVRNSLEKIFLENGKISEIKTFRKDLRFEFPIKEFSNWKNSQVVSIERRAKYLLLRSSSGVSKGLVCHLGMTGGFRLLDSSKKSRNQETIKHIHLEFHFENGQRLVYYDPRRFGFFLEWPGDWSKVSREPMGPEPLEPSWTAEVLFQGLRKKLAPIKPTLMDQRVVVGIGNIYASEVLYAAGISPSRASARVTRKECQKIVQESKRILLAAIRSGGSRIRDYASPEGGAVEFQNQHLVYGLEGKLCLKCKTKIKKKIQSGRATFWCSKCQD